VSESTPRSSGASEPPGGQEKETLRTEAFSDGVFSIAITLLVLDLKVPRTESVQGGAGLAAALLAQWPSYLAFLTSFVTILIMWVNHHNLFTYIRRSDGLFLFLNGLVLLTVTVIPFPTSLLAAHFRQPEAHVAAAIYAGTFLCNCASFNLLWRYAAKGKRALDPGMDERLIAGIKRQAVTGMALYVVATLLAFVSVAASVAMCMALAAFFAVTGSMHHLLVAKGRS
jgi:uncharacterized membrane protein